MAINEPTSDDIQQASSKAPGQYEAAVSRILQEFPSGFRYYLLQLTVVGLGMADVDPLAEVARLAFSEFDVSKSVDNLKAIKTASPLAVAIASTVASAVGSKRLAMIGAVTGAMVAVESGLSGPAQTVDAITAAVGGATALSAWGLIEERFAAESWSNFSRPEQPT